MAACPYDAIFINPEDHSAEKCNFCAHRLDIGLEPACVVVCPTEAILVGRPERPHLGRSSQIVNRAPVAVRRPEKETRPKVFYKGAHQATLDPLAARRPDGDIYMWSEQRRRPGPGRRRSPRRAPTPRPRPCWPTTCPTRRPGTGGSASTRGPRASPRAPSWWPSSSPWPGRSSGADALVRWVAPLVSVAFLGDHRRAADLGPGAPRPLLLHLHAAAVAVAGWSGAASSSAPTATVLGLHLVAQRARARRRRCQVLAVAGHPRWRCMSRRLHRLPVRPGQGPRPVAEPAAAAAPGRPGRAGRCGGPGRRRRRRTAAPSTRSAGPLAGAAPSTCSWWRARSPSPTPPPTPTWPPGR